MSSTNNLAGPVVLRLGRSRLGRGGGAAALRLGRGFLAARLGFGDQGHGFFGDRVFRGFCYGCPTAGRAVEQVKCLRFVRQRAVRGVCLRFSCGPGSVARRSVVGFGREQGGAFGGGGAMAGACGVD